MQSLELDISLTAEQLQAYYAGQVTQVWARAQDGRSVQFPISSLRPFISHHGVSGRFRMVIDGQHRLTELERVTIKR